MSGKCIFKALLPLALVAVAGCGSDAPDDATQHPRAEEVVRIVSAEQALATVHVPTVDPSTMVEAEIREAIGAGPRCEFRYTSSGKPVLAIEIGPQGAPSRGVVKLKGAMVLLAPSERAAKGSIALAAAPIRMAVMPHEPVAKDNEGAYSHRESEAVFEVGDVLKVGYGGYLDCGSSPPFRMPVR